MATYQSKYSGAQIDEAVKKVLDNEYPSSGVQTPFFDLKSLGLPTVSTDGTTSDLTTSTSSIRSALDNGAVKFALNVKGFGDVNVIMNACVNNGAYLCTYVAQNLTLTLIIAENAIQASATPVTATATYNGEVEVV